MEPNEKNELAAYGTGGQGVKGQAKKAGSKGSRASDSTDKNTRGLEVSSMVDGYRRGGREWTKAAQVVPLSNFTDEQIAQLEWDTNLRVVEVDLPAESEAE